MALSAKAQDKLRMYGPTLPPVDEALVTKLVEQARTATPAQRTQVAARFERMIEDNSLPTIGGQKVHMNTVAAAVEAIRAL